MRRIYEPEAYDETAREGCFWQLPSGNWPPLSGSHEVDFAILGGGYTGLSAALHLAGAGAGSVLVLEAQSPGWGASGRNGGFCCLGGSSLDEPTLARRHGSAAARAFLGQQRDAIELVAGLIERHGIDADRHSDGEIILAHRESAVSALRDEARQLAGHGVAAEFVDRAGLARRGIAGPEFHAGLHVRLGFALDPAKYAGGLARAAQAAGARICAHSPVTSVTPIAGGYRLQTPRGKVMARHLILATNGYSSEDVPGWLAGRYLPVQSNILVTRPITAEEQAQQGWSSDLMAYDSRTLLHYFRLLPDGRFLFGMRGNIRATRPSLAAMQRNIRRDFQRMFPAWRQVETTHFWSGLICMTRKQTPYIGPVDGWKNAWAGLGYHGNGVAMGTLAGALLADLALGRGEPGQVLSAAAGRFPLGRGRRFLLAPAFAWYRLKDG